MKKVQSSKLTNKTDIDTFDAWLDHQSGHVLEKGSFRSFTEGTMPADTTRDWLAKQLIGEAVPKEAEGTLPTSTTETWIRKQVSDRMLVEERAAQVATQP